MSHSEIKSRIIKCAKNHPCEWCATRIQKGEKAMYRVYVNDGDFMSGWMHPECWEAMEKSDRHDLLDGWQSGDFERGVPST